MRDDSWDPGVSEGSHISEEHYQAYARRFGVGDSLVPNRVGVTGDAELSASASVTGDGRSSAPLGSALFAPTTRPYSSSVSSEGKKGGSTVHEDDDSDDAAAKEVGAKKAKVPKTVSGSSRKLTGPLTDTDFESTKAYDQWSSVEFLNAKQSLKFKCAVETGRLAGKFGMVHLLTKALETARAKSCELSDLPDSDELMGRLVKQRDLVEQLDRDAIKATRGNFMELKGEYQNQLGVIDRIEESYKELMEGLAYKVKQSGIEQRRMYATSHWQGAKAMNHYQKGGHGEGVAKYLGFKTSAFEKAVANGSLWETLLPTGVVLNPTAEEFDLGLPCVFAAETDKNITVEGLEFFESIAEACDEKYLRMVHQMNENPRWVGCLGVIEAPIVDSSFVRLGKGISSDEGSKPSLQVFRNNARRHLAKEVPFHATAGCFHNTGAIVIFVLAIPIEGILARGITMDTIERYIDTTEGYKYVDKYGITTPLSPKATLYMPAGFAIFVTSHEVPDRRGILGTSQYLHFALTGAFANEVGLSGTVKHAIMQNNHSHLDPKSTTSAMWMARLEFFKTIFKLD